MSRRFEPGDRVLLFDSKGRKYLLTLATGGEFHTLFLLLLNEGVQSVGS